MLSQKIGNFPSGENIKSSNLAFFVEAYLIVGSLTKYIHTSTLALTDAGNHWFNHLFYFDIRTVQLYNWFNPQNHIHGFYSICDTDWYSNTCGLVANLLCLPPRNLGHIDQWSKAHHGSRQHPGDVFLYRMFCGKLFTVSMYLLLIAFVLIFDYFVWIVCIIFFVAPFVWHHLSHIISWYLMISCISCGNSKPWGFEDPKDLS